MKSSIKVISQALILLASFSIATASNAASLHQEKEYKSEGVITYSIENSRSEAIAQWRVPEENLKAIVLSVHGFGLNKCAFKALAEQLQAKGIATYAIDIRGFGNWANKANGSTQIDPEKTLLDMKSALIALRNDNPSTPVFVMGESLGGAIALKAAADFPELIDGAISSVPAGDRYKSKRTALGLAFKTLIGKGGHINIGKQVIAQATRDESLKTEWKSDPASRLTVSTHELLVFSKFMKANHQVVKDIKNTAVLMLQGDADRLVKPSGTVRLFEELNSSDKKLMIVKNSEHLILEHGQFDQSTLEQVENWIANHETSKSLVAIK